MQVEGLDTTVIDYINEIKANYEQQIKELRNKIESSVKEIKEYQNKYLALKEEYDLLMHKKFGRSAEQILADEKQQLLFTDEEEQSQAEETEELQTVASFRRKKPGRKPLGAHLTREEKIIDIPESEKIYPLKKH
jgi:hypothetical protein